MGYNGWSNYETWLVSLHIDNDHGLYHHVNELTEEVLNEYPVRDDLEDLTNRSAEHELSERIEEEINLIAECRSGDESPLISDLLQGAINKVDFYEIAKSKIENYEEEVTV